MKTLSERIAARAVEKKPLLSNKKQNRAIFLALRPEIIKALNDGWPVKDIWETLRAEGKVAFCYSAFCGYTKKLIRTSPDHVPEHSHEPDGADKTAKRTILEPPKTKVTPEISGFIFNPSPKKEDLI
jgi:hypothetical protein